SATRCPGSMIVPPDRLRHDWLPPIVVLISFLSTLHAFVQQRDRGGAVETHLIRIIHRYALLPECGDRSGYQVIPAMRKSSMIVHHGKLSCGKICRNALATMLHQAPEVFVVVASPDKVQGVQLVQPVLQGARSRLHSESANPEAQDDRLVTCLPCVVCI